MRPTMRGPFKTQARNYALYGALFGAVFPLVATIVDSLDSFGSISISTAAQVQSSNPLHWIIDSAPFWLGLFAGFGGAKQDKVNRHAAMLEESEMHFRALTEDSLDGVVIMDSNASMRYVSPSFERMLGYQPEERQGKDVFELVHEDDMQPAASAFSKVLDGQASSTQVEVRVRHKDGSWRVVEAMGHNLLDNPAVSGILANFRDITDRKQAEQALQESWARYQALFEGSSNPITLLDRDGVVLMVNALGAENLSLPPEACVGKSIFEIVPDMADAFRDLYQQVVDEGMEMSREDCVELPSGPKWFWSVHQPVSDASGKRYGVQVVSHDITERKLAERELHLLLATQEEQNQQLQRAQMELAQALEAGRRSEEKLKRYLESSPDIICVVDLQGIILYVNKATEKLIGYNRAELVGKSFTALNLLTPESQSKPKEWTYRGGAEKSTRSHEVEILKKDGKVVVLDIASYPMGQGLNAEIIAIGRDITEHRKMEEDKQRMEQQLLLSGRLAAVGELAAGVAHELNNPLAAVQGYAQFLTSRSDLDETMREDVETIYKEAQRASRITANLLQFARKHEPEKNPISINKVIEDSVELHAYRMKVNNIEIAPELDPDLPETMGDYYQLQQVFVNIITNADHAMTQAHGRGKLTIKTRRSRDAIQVAFTDDGPGIEEKTLKQVFDPFFTTKEVGEGTGLGLSICFGIVEQHGGTMRATSKVGKGATFVVEIPVVSEDQAADDRVDSVENPSRQMRPT